MKSFIAVIVAFEWVSTVAALPTLSKYDVISRSRDSRNCTSRSYSALRSELVPET